MPTGLVRSRLHSKFRHLYGAKSVQYSTIRCLSGHSAPSTNHESPSHLLDPPNLNLTYPPNSPHLNPQHFHQKSLTQWLQKRARPLTLAQMADFGRNLSEAKLLLSANHVAEEITIRFAKRLRQMQMLPYRLMGHPVLLQTYERYVDSFEMLRRIGPITNLEQNEKLIALGHQLMQKHTETVANAISGLRDILSRPHKLGDESLLHDFGKKMVTSRLSRRVLLEQHTALTRSWQNRGRMAPNRQGPQTIGEITLNCRIIDALTKVERKTKKLLAKIYNIPVDNLAPVVVEGSPTDLAVEFPYILPHFEFVLGELLYNSMEACLRQPNVDPIGVTISSTPETVMIRLSDQAGGLSGDQIGNLWTFVGNNSQNVAITPQAMANHQFFSLLFPKEEVSPWRQPVDGSHFGLGLALSRIYVEYWGGALELHSIEGFGCDALLRVSRTGRNRENLLIR